MHGSTLVYTRLIGVAQINRWRDISTETYDEHVRGHFWHDIGEPSFHLEDERGKPWNTKDISDIVVGVLEKYNQVAQDVKETYKAKILEREDFREYG